MSKRPTLDSAKKLALAPAGRVAISLCLAAFALASLPIDKKSPISETRSPASFLSGKSMKLQAQQAPILKHSHKLRGPLQVVIHTLGAPPERSGDTFTLEARVVSQRDLEQTQGHWVIPNGVEIVQGSSKVTFTQLKAKQEQTVRIVLKQLSGENQKIHFKVRSILGSTAFSDASQFNSLSQIHIDKEKFLLKQRANENIRSSKNRLKVFE